MTVLIVTIWPEGDVSGTEVPCRGALHHGSRKPVSNLPRTKFTVRTTKPTTGAAGSATKLRYSTPASSQPSLTLPAAPQRGEGRGGSSHFNGEAEAFLLMSATQLYS